MTTKKTYITPEIDVVFIGSTPILAGSGPSITDMDKDGSPFKSPAKSSLFAPEYFDSWVEDDEY